MSSPEQVPASLALDALSGDARGAFDLAASAGYRGIAFATNHSELNPDLLGTSARRHVKTLLASKRLSLDSLRAAAPRTGLTDPGTIDRTLENARKALLLARELGIATVSLNVGTLTGDPKLAKVPRGTVVSALRELAQQADAADLTLAISAEGSNALGEILKAVDYDKARLNLDAARLIGAGEDPLKVAEELAGTIAQFTAADAVRSGKSVRATELGEGQLPLHELLEILEEQGFRGPVVVDPRDLADPIDGARHAAAVLRTLLGR
jgi:sugar phosphate isomerase/epimerase